MICVGVDGKRRQRFDPAPLLALVPGTAAAQAERLGVTTRTIHATRAAPVEHLGRLVGRMIPVSIPALGVRVIAVGPQAVPAVVRHLRQQHPGHLIEVDTTSLSSTDGTDLGGAQHGSGAPEATGLSDAARALHPAGRSTN